MGHYASEVDYYDREDRDKRDKILIEKSLLNLSTFTQSSYTAGIQAEIESIRKYYKSKLYDLRHIKIDS